VRDDENSQPREFLRGARIRRIAGQIVARSEDPLRSRHYTEWFQELLDHGYAVAGRDPLAAFLTQLNRSPAVLRESEPGTYRLDFEVVSALETQLLDLNQSLARLHQGQQTIEGIASVREERERITASIDQLERTLAEAHATLHRT
jgi:exonuclease VII small subunit